MTGDACYVQRGARMQAISSWSKEHTELLNDEFRLCPHLRSKVIVSMSEINWTKKGTNPIDSVGFFDSYDDTKKREVHAHQVTSMMPSEFQVRHVVPPLHKPVTP